MSLLLLLACMSVVIVLVLAARVTRTAGACSAASLVVPGACIARPVVPSAAVRFAARRVALLLLLLMLRAPARCRRLRRGVRMDMVVRSPARTRWSSSALVMRWLLHRSRGTVGRRCLVLIGVSHVPTVWCRR